MAPRLIRQGSDTPNVTNHDDARMARYAYSGYDGYIKGVGDEIGHEINGANFVVQSGVIVLQGWEVEIDANGVTIVASASVAQKEYYSVYLEVNCATDSAEIKAMTAQTGFPEISAGDDLTANTIGTARLLLYHFIATSGAIADVEKMVCSVEYLGEKVDGIIDGTIKPEDSKKVNGLEIKRDEAGVLKIGDSVIPQKKLLWEGEQQCSKTNPKLFLFNTSIPVDSLLEVNIKITGAVSSVVSRSKYRFYMFRPYGGDTLAYNPKNIYANVQIPDNDSGADEQTEVSTIGKIQNHYNGDAVDGITIYSKKSKWLTGSSMTEGAITITKIYHVIE